MSMRTVDDAVDTEESVMPMRTVNEAVDAEESIMLIRTVDEAVDWGECPELKQQIQLLISNVK